MPSFALIDSLHLHEKNFASLFAYFTSNNITPSVLITKEQSRFKLITAAGKYSRHLRQDRKIGVYMDLFMRCSSDELFTFTRYSIPLWDICRSELLCYLLTLDSWQKEIIVKDSLTIFEKAFVENYEDLLLNMAMAAFWLDEWYEQREEIFKNNFVCVFSGSSIYTRTIMALLRRGSTHCIVMESTFTGNDYLFEERYHPIANNSLIQYPAWRQKQRPKNADDPGFFEREVIKAKNKMLDMANKNVKQPSATVLPSFANPAPQVLIAGQVANDFSIIENGFPFVSTIPLYRELIESILDETDYNIVFKTHPWERKKVHISRSYTFEELTKFIDGLPDEQKSRILLIEDANIYNLIEGSQYFVTICSQSGIEAALRGLKPFTLGKTFYSGSGFTLSFDNVETLVKALKTESGEMSLNEYRCFESFIVDFFQNTTVAQTPSGLSILKKRIDKYSRIEQKMTNRSELDAIPLTSRNSLLDSTRHFSLKYKSEPTQEMITELKGISVAFEEADQRTFKPGEKSTLLLAIQNDSDALLPKLVGKTPIELSYHILDKDGKVLEWNGVRTEPYAPIVMNMTQKIRFIAPSRPGEYFVKPGIVASSIRWFDGDRTISIVVN